MFVVILCGLISRNILPIANEPEIEVPYFYIVVVHEGISPEDSERLLVQPMEIELRKVEGIKELNAFASEGSATLFVEFDASHDLDQAMIDVREAADRARPEIPSTSEEPIVRELDLEDFATIQVNLIAENASERAVYQSAIKLKDQIEALPDVLSVAMQGQREELLEVIIDPQALDSYQISSEELLLTLQRNNRLIPAGSIDTGKGRFSVKVPSVVEEAHDVMNLPVSTVGDSVITLQDVATIRRTFKDRSNYARINGRKAISLQVRKRTNANIIGTTRKVRQVVTESRTQIPEGIEILLSQDQAEFAVSQVTELQGNIFTALALVMVLVVAAMGFRSGVIVGLGIPVSLLFSLIIIYLLGYTFNFMVMFGMLLGLGMLIDGAIVVTEYADRKMGEGMNHKQAYSNAVKRMFWPVVASTATTLAAFLPLVFWPGIPGQFMSYLPVTVFTVLIGSLLYALLFGPVLGTLFGKPTAHSKASANMKQLERGDPAELATITGSYARLLRLICHHPLATLAVIISLLLSIFWCYSQFGRGIIFFSESDAQFLQVSVRAQGNFSAAETNELVKQVEEEILQVKDLRAVNSQTKPGTNADIRNGSQNANDAVGFIFIELNQEHLRQRSGHEIVAEIRKRTHGFPGIKVDVILQEQGPPVGKAIQIELGSRNRALLEPAIAHIRNYFDTLPELIDIDDTRALPSIEWQVKVDRAQASLYGADVSSAGTAVQLVTNGVKVAEYRPDGAEDEVDIRVRYPVHERGLQALDNLKVSTNQGMVPLSNFVTLEAAPGVDTYERIDGIPVERIRANVVEGVLADNMVPKIARWLEQQGFDPSITITFRGASEEQESTFAFVQVAFLLSLILMFILLVTQFNSFYQSTLILLAVIMSTAGVLLGLLILGKAFSAILTGVGVVALAGIVVNNNIVLIDTFNYLRRQHPALDAHALIVRAGAQRLRPVMLTTVTTVFGLLPLACGLSVDLINRKITASGQMATFWEPLSQAIVFGLSFATILTLIATPAMLALPSHIKCKLSSLRPVPAKQ